MSEVLSVCTHPCFFSHSSAWIFLRVSGSMSSTCFFFLACLLATQSRQVQRGPAVQSPARGDTLQWEHGNIVNMVVVTIMSGYHVLGSHL